jgi:hypothetical protein
MFGDFTGSEEINAVRQQNRVVREALERNGGKVCARGFSSALVKIRCNYVSYIKTSTGQSKPGNRTLNI